MAGDEFMQEVPFRNVYLTGIVRDKLGRKMSKTLGNSPDPLVLIEKYGADAVRIGMLLCSSAGNDIFYDEKQVEQGRNFCGKIWNSWRLISGWNVSGSTAQPEASAAAVEWFRNRLAQAVETVEDDYAKFRISDALMTIYKLFWDEFCSWYLEAVKPAHGESIDKETYNATLSFFEDLLKLIHPVMPFITEELWHAMSERGEGETIMFQHSPVSAGYDEQVIAAFNMAQELVNGIRGVRKQKNIPPKEQLSVAVDSRFPASALAVAAKLADATFTAGLDEGAAVSFMVGTCAVSVVLSGHVDVEEEKARILKDLEYQRGFLASVRKKLGNESFTAHAPEKVIEMERRKEADSLSKIEAYEAALKALEN